MPQRVPFRPKQSLGQNFMHDPNTVRKIVGALQAPPDAHVVEVGAGTGALTEELQQRYHRLTVIEIDERAIAVLRGRFPDLDVREHDMLALDWAALADEKGRPLHVISNTPYNLTSELLFALLDVREHVAEAVLTMQKEVAERIVAEPRTKAYGILSVIMQLYADPELLFTVSRHVFYPQPDVTSACVRFTYHPPGDDGFDVDPKWLRMLVRTAFNQRRKMLRNSLSAWTKDRGIELPNDWGRRRPESLAPADFVELAQYLDAQIHDA
jgi:16S rRNA (adenine1518-N6/adenine1519-N6)-dimethyltransferase